MGIDTKAEQLIIQLTRETYSNNVKWEAKDAPESLDTGTEDLFPLYLETTYKNIIVALYERRFKYYVDEHDYNWSQDIGFSIVDKQGRVVWEYGQRSAALINLFDAAREQVSGIDTILDGLLDD